MSANIKSLPILFCTLQLATLMISSGAAVTFNVSGRTVCANIASTTGEIPPPMRGVIVQLYEEDNYDPNDKLDEKTTGELGEFSLWGDEGEIGDEEPVLIFIHNCPQKKDEAPLNAGCHYNTRFDLKPFYDSNLKDNQIHGQKYHLASAVVTKDGQAYKMTDTQVKC